MNRNHQPLPWRKSTKTFGTIHDANGAPVAYVEGADTGNIDLILAGVNASRTTPVASRYPTTQAISTLTTIRDRQTRLRSIHVVIKSLHERCDALRNYSLVLHEATENLRSLHCRAWGCTGVESSSDPERAYPCWDCFEAHATPAERAVRQSTGDLALALAHEQSRLLGTRRQASRDCRTLQRQASPFVGCRHYGAPGTPEALPIECTPPSLPRNRNDVVGTGRDRVMARAMYDAREEQQPYGRASSSALACLPSPSSSPSPSAFSARRPTTNAPRATGEMPMKNQHAEINAAIREALLQQDGAEHFITGDVAVVLRVEQEPRTLEYVRVLRCKECDAEVSENNFCECIEPSQESKEASTATPGPERELLNDLWNFIETSPMKTPSGRTSSSPSASASAMCSGAVRRSRKIAHPHSSTS
jgi:hypothetical protein